MEDWAQRVSQSDSAQARANYAEKKELQKAPAAPRDFKHGAEHPKHEHVEEQVKKTGMNESIRQELIDMAMDNVMGTQRQRVENGIGEIYLAYRDKYQPKKVNTRVYRNQCLDGPRKRRE